MIPPSSSGGGGRLRALFHRWFVQYNPLYFASALCVMAGVLLLSEAFAEAGAGSTEVGLTAVLELYQWLLVGAAGLLFRRPGGDQRRPAVILGIVAMVFLGDPTLQIERMALLGSAGLLPAALWVGSVLLKLRALAWAFRLRASPGFYGVVTLGAFVLAALPQLPPGELLATGMMAAIFGVGAVLVLSRPRLESRESDEVLGDWGRTVLRRSTRAAAGLWLGLAAYHLAGFSLPLGTSVLPSLLAAGVLVAALRMERELSVWARVAGALGLGLLGDPALFPVVLVLAAVAALLLAWRRSPRMLVATAVFTYFCAVLVLERLGLASALPGVALGVVLALTLLLWRYRVWSAAMGTIVLGLDLGVRLGLLREPRGSLEWGAVLVIGGFVFLAGGLALNLWSPRVDPGKPERHLRIL